MTMKAKHVKPTDPTLADQYNDLVDDVGNLVKSQVELGKKVDRQEQPARPFLALVNNEASGGDGEYDEWDEVYRNDANTAWVVIPGGRTEATTSQSLYEFSGAEGFASTIPVWVFPSRDSQGNRRYMFFAQFPAVIYGHLTSESTGEYAWAEMVNDFSVEKAGGLTSANTGFNVSIYGLTGLPVAAGVGEDSMKVVIFPRPPSLSTPETCWQAWPAIDKNGTRITVTGGHGVQDGGATAVPLVDTPANDWDIETQNADDFEGAFVSVMDTAGYTHATSSTDGHLAVGWSNMTIDTGGRVTGYANTALYKSTLADVRQCPPLPVTATNDIVGIYT